MAYKNLDPGQSFSPRLLLKLASGLLDMGRSGKALKLLEEGLCQYPGFTDLLYMKAFILNEHGKQIQAMDCCKKCWEMGEAPEDLASIPGAGTYRSLCLAGGIYLGEEDFKNAAGCFLKALEYQPGFETALVGTVRAFCGARPPEKRLRGRIEGLRSAGVRIPGQVLYDELMQQKYYGLAAWYIEKAEGESGKTAETIYKKGLCRAMTKRYGEASSLALELRQEEGCLSRGACLQALCSILQGDYDSGCSQLEASDGCSDDPGLSIYRAFAHYLKTGGMLDLENNAEKYVLYADTILELIKVFIHAGILPLAAKAADLLGIVNERTSLLKLAKLYYREKHYGRSYREFMRSVKLYGVIDMEGAGMIKRLKGLGY